MHSTSLLVFLINSFSVNAYNFGVPTGRGELWFFLVHLDHSSAVMFFFFLLSICIFFFNHTPINLSYTNLFKIFFSFNVFI